MFDSENLDNCTLQQACEWIAFQRPPMTTTQEEASGFIRPNPETTNDSIWGQYVPKPTYTWEEYLQKMTISCAKLKLALIEKNICVFGRDKNFPTILSPHPQSISISEDDKLNWDQNIISSTFFTFTDVFINFAELRKIFPGPNTWQKPMTLSLKYEDDDCVYLYTGNLQKTLIKKFARNDNKSRQVIKYIMQHPGKLITRDEIIQYGIKGFDKEDRIDNILKNAFAILNIYKYFFKNPKTASVEFVEQITNLDIDSDQIDMIIIK